jgi:putative transposase
MPDYRRTYATGACWFFTVNLHNRHQSLLIDEIDLLKCCIRKVQQQRPFTINAWVVLPEHMHCLWTLPAGDTDYAGRWLAIKKAFSRVLPRTEYRNTSQIHRRERGIWQRRYWEHRIRDEADYWRHFDYIHVNPLKHGWVNRVQDWPYSTFHRYVKVGFYTIDWCGDSAAEIAGDG